MAFVETDFYIKIGKNSPYWRGCGKLSSKKFSEIKRKAKQRNIDFQLTIEEAWDIFVKQRGKCKLTGIQLKFPKTARSLGNASLDRVNSKKGYFKENVQWVHKDINMMKGSLSDKKFKELCKRVTNKNKK